MKLPKPENISKFIYWTPRILSILFIVFLIIFSLDVFEPGLSVKEIAIGLFIHNIPALILLAALVISWKYEIVGGVTFTLAGILYIVTMLLAHRFNDKDMWLPFLMIAGPAFLIGILFILNWMKKRKNLPGQTREE